MSDKPVAMYREKCADGSRCLHGCHTNEPCHTRQQPEAEQEPPSGFFSREAMKEHSDFHPQPKAEKQEPVATVTGVYGGRFIVEPTNSAMVLPVNMALYTQPQRRKQVKFPTMLRKMWSGGEVQAWLDENVNKE